MLKALFAASVGALLLAASGAASAQAPGSRAAVARPSDPPRPSAIDRALDRERALRTSSREEEPRACPLPLPPRAARVAVVSADEAGALSTASVAGPHQATGHAVLEVEPGAEPLYLLLTTYEPTIWTVTGATHRLAQVVVSSPLGGGVVGALAGTVLVLGGAPASCLAGLVGGDPVEASAARARLRASLAREPEREVVARRPVLVRVPSGRTISVDQGAARPAPPPAFDPAAWRAALRFRPAGVHAVNPGAVMGAHAEPYVVLPEGFGLAQLLGSGALARLAPGDYRVVRPIPHWPAGLSGAHSVRFLIARGVPRPAGDPGHSCVVSEDPAEATDPRAWSPRQRMRDILCRPRPALAEGGTWTRP